MEPITDHISLADFLCENTCSMCSFPPTDDHDSRHWTLCSLKNLFVTLHRSELFHKALKASAFQSQLGHQPG